LKLRTNSPRLAPIIKKNVGVETDVKHQVVKAAKTKQNAKSKLATNTWALKIKIPNKFKDKVAKIGAKYQLHPAQRCVEIAEKNQVVKASKTKQNAESKLAINTWAHILESIKNNVEEKTAKNSHAEPKRVAVKVNIERAETEEHYVES
jgi:hypothetical protein